MNGPIPPLRDLGETQPLRRFRSIRALEEFTSNTAMQALALAFPQMVWMSDPMGAIDFLTQQWEDYLGRKRDDLLGDLWMTSLHPDDERRTRLAWNEALEMGEEFQLEFRLRRFDNIYRWHLGRAVPFRDEKWRVAKWFGTCTDIDDQLRAAEALRQSHEVLETMVEERTQDLKDEVEQRRVTEHELRKIQGQQRAILDNIPDMAWLKDRESRFIAVNDALGAAFQKPPQNFVGLTDHDLFTRELSEGYRRDDFEVMKTKQRIRVDEQFVGSDGQRRWIETVKGPVFGEDGVVIGTTGIARDITQRKAAERALQDSEQRYALAARGANDGLWDWDIETGDAYFSARYKAILGCREGEIFPRIDEWLKRIHPSDIDRVRADIKLHFEGRTPHFQSEHRIVHKSGALVDALIRGVAVRRENGDAYRMAGSLTDITDRRKREAKTNYEALHDPLTGLPNSSLMMDRLSQAVRRRGRSTDYCFALLLIDIDNFQSINESVGHLAGDQMLAGVAQRLGLMLRSVDTVARLGGDEFAILLDGARGLSSVELIANRVLHSLAEPFELQDQKITATASIGVTICGKNNEVQAPELLRQADLSLIEAKRQGRGRFTLFHPSLTDKGTAPLRVETDLRQALENNELTLHYQPIFSLSDRRVAGFEALLRWMHPTKGLLAPRDFMNASEETGMIIPIGEWVIVEACKQLRRWKEAMPELGPLSVSVNLSDRQFSDGRLLMEVEHAVRDAELLPGDFRVEITESVFMENPDETARLLAQLRKLGIHATLDDFGSGYSTLGYLQRFPLPRVKMDRMLVNCLNIGGREQDFIDTTLALGETLGIEVTAQGIETAEQLDELQKRGCLLGQGIFLCPALTAEEAEKLLGEESVEKV
ncbi:hypothetical protein BH09SUM1_BH09SUM1_05830 [soil metagenome]